MAPMASMRSYHHGDLGVIGGRGGRNPEGLGGSRWPVDHTPQVPADDRALRLIEHSGLDAVHKRRLADVVKASQDAAHEAGAELQAEFGKEHVALIVGCNQFVRLWRAGTQPGAVELLLDPKDKAGLAAAGFELKEPEGAVFKLFGWVRLDPTKGADEALEEATRKAFAKARAQKGGSKSSI
jgi:hypothetical protein